ncbi:hypothetical protein EYF80_031568 [Liparis tanakae]|uniref:Uncharacterized protein n=1 Tax=Liparis tanakae TaxID=230148 RepID=A0A4Z2GX93_9TELE|nr:hypothetical protein EYF80_031568 [Liparis tanakae]
MPFWSQYADGAGLDVASCSVQAAEITKSFEYCSDNQSHRRSGSRQHRHFWCGQSDARQGNRGNPERQRGERGRVEAGGEGCRD